MSRIGNKVITIPAGVEVKIENWGDATAKLCLPIILFSSLISSAPQIKVSVFIHSLKFLNNLICHSLCHIYHSVCIPW